MFLQPKKAPNAPKWLTLSAAARSAGCSRATIAAAIRRGDIRAYCDSCQTKIAPEELAEGHDCSEGLGTQPGGAYRILVKPSDAEKYHVDETHRLSGLASAKSKAKARKETAA